MKVSLLICRASLALALSGLSLTGAAADTGTGGERTEAQLLSIFADIEANRLDQALATTDRLLSRQPNFRLAHLIKGDLLLARVRPLKTFGNVDNAPQDQIADLRAEAMVRLKAYREKPAADSVPRYLLQMHPQQRYALVVDTHKSRLYVYANVDGRPRFVADYYVTHGKAGTEKRREGDKRTPIGVYHVTASLPRNKLADLYGSGAFPINYPNEWDRRLGRAGHGIWLHGTPSDTFARPPRASDGCVVLANEDLDTLARSFQIGLTPVIISNKIEWLSLDDWQAERKNLLAFFESWRRDWESGDIERYLRHYSSQFQSDRLDFAGWAARKRQIAASKQWVKVATSNLSVFRDPGQDDLVVVTFDQDYRSNSLADRTTKRQYWRKERGEWKIIYEAAA